MCQALFKTGDDVMVSSTIEGMQIKRAGLLRKKVSNVLNRYLILAAFHSDTKPIKTSILKDKIGAIYGSKNGLDGFLHTNLSELEEEGLIRHTCLGSWELTDEGLNARNYWYSNISNVGNE